MLAQLGGALTGQDGPCDEVRITTDLLMVNPNKGFKWHQDNQNGPIDAFGEPGANEWNALRWWVTMDDCPADHGAPVYLRKSHLNTDVTTEAVFVDLEKDGLLAYPEVLERLRGEDADRDVFTDASSPLPKYVMITMNSPLEAPSLRKATFATVTRSCRSTASRCKGACSRMSSSRARCTSS